MNTPSRSTLFAATVVAVLLGSVVAVEAQTRFYPGYVKMELYFNNGGTVSVDDLRADPNYPASPGRVEYITAPESGTGIAENYGGRISGVIVPATGGNSIFYLSADDGAEFWLSTDATPANVALQATEPVWANYREWTGDSGARRAGCLTGDCENDTVPIALVAAQQRYFEVLWKEGGGGDHAALTFAPSAGPAPVNGSPSSLTNTLIGVTAPDLAIITQPVNQTAAENLTATFTVVAANVPGLAYQWQVNTVDIPGANAASYTTPPLTLADSGKSYRCVVSAALAQQITSSAATVTVTGDTTPPTIVSIGTFIDNNGALVTFSEQMGTGFDTAANYTISGGVTVSGSVRVSDRVVFLNTSTMAASTAFTLTANSSVRDAAAGGGNAVTPNTANFTSSAPPPAGQTFNNAIRYERWEAPAAGGIAGLTNEIALRAPDNTSLRGDYGAPINVMDGYGARLSGYIVPPTTGDYVFFIATDDPGEFWLSTDSSVANKKLVATEPGWNPVRAWTGSANGRSATNPENRTDMYLGTQWPGGNTITLIGGQKYYTELLFVEGGGGDNGDVTMKLASDPDPANGTLSTLTGTRVGVYADLATSAPIITVRPTRSTYNKGDTVTFTGDAIGGQPMTFQWSKGGVPIPGATSKTYTIVNADHTAIGDYSIEFSNAFGTVNTLPDDGARALMRGGFNIEAADYNFGGGQTTNVASVMPYAGNAYLGITNNVLDVDFWHDGDNSGNNAAAYAYARFNSADVGTIETKGPADPADYERGGFSVTANYALGWTAVGEWQNYTRTFPAGNYVVYLAAAHDGRAVDEININLTRVANPTIADGSSAGTEGGAQGLTVLGTFLGPASGAWSSNDMFPLRDAGGTGAIAQVALSGTQTLRLTFNSADGDADYLLLYNLSATPPPTIAISRNASGQPVLTYTGTLQSAPTVTGAFGPVAGAVSPFTVTAPGAQQFYRSSNP